MSDADIFAQLQIPETLAAGPGPGNTDERVLASFAKAGLADHQSDRRQDDCRPHRLGEIARNDRQLPVAGPIAQRGKLHGRLPMLAYSAESMGCVAPVSR